MTTSDAELLILVDNRVAPEHREARLRPAWGLSILVNGEVLFDLGPSPFVLRHNAQALGVLEQVLGAKYVVISHLHSDHIGGLKLLLGSQDSGIRPRQQRIYLVPQSSLYDVIFPEQSLVINRYESIEIGDRYRLLNFETDSGLREQVLIVESSHGKVVIVGCMHMGLDRLLEAIDGEIALILGGFHTHFLDPETREHYLKLLDNARIHGIAPIHCSGEAFVEQCRRRLGKRCLNLGVGSRILLG